MSHKAFQADFIYLGNQEKISNGIIELNANGEITHLGEKTSSSDIKTKKLNGFLCPGFINTHCHLELSHLQHKVSKGTKLHGFVQDLQKVRKADEATISQAIASAELSMRNNGIVAVGDISNGEDSFQTKSLSPIFFHTFVELFGFDKLQADRIYTRGLELKHIAQNRNLNASVVPHSSYSVSNELMKLIGKTQKNAPITIHNQETEAENSLFQKGEGEIKEMLKRFGLDLSTFKPIGKSSIFNYLAFLNTEVNTLLVHNTFTKPEDIEWAEQNHAHLYWCFCPNANQYIEKRLPNIPQFIDAGVSCTLGTDSLASNWQLSIWAEIETIQMHYPQIKTELLIEMACQNGAKFLGIDNQFGKLEIGKKPGLNWVNQGAVNKLA